MNAHNSEIIGLLAETVAAPPPKALSGAIGDAARSSRPSGQAISSLGGGQRAHPAAAFAQTIDEFRSVLATADGSAIVEPYGWSVTQLVAHLLEPKPSIWLRSILTGIKSCSASMMSNKRSV